MTVRRQKGVGRSEFQLSHPEVSLRGRIEVSLRHWRDTHSSYILTVLYGSRTRIRGSHASLTFPNKSRTSISSSSSSCSSSSGSSGSSSGTRRNSCSSGSSSISGGRRSSSISGGSSSY